MHVELVGEFARWSEDVIIGRILARMRELKITVDATSGMKLGFAVSSGGDGFLAELKGLIPMVQRLGCGQIILLSGKRTEGAAPGAQHLASIETLKHAAEILSAMGLTGVIEPIDRLENPSIYLYGVEEAFKIVRAVGSPKVKVLYDLHVFFRFSIRYLALRQHRQHLQHFTVSNAPSPHRRDRSTDGRLITKQDCKSSGMRQIVSRGPSVAPGAQHLASIEMLKHAAEILSAMGLTGVIEPIDRLENPSIYLYGVRGGVRDCSGRRES